MNRDEPKLNVDYSGITRGERLKNYLWLSFLLFCTVGALGVEGWRGQGISRQRKLIEELREQVTAQAKMVEELREQVTAQAKMVEELRKREAAQLKPEEELRKREAELMEAQDRATRRNLNDYLKEVHLTAIPESGRILRYETKGDSLIEVLFSPFPIFCIDFDFTARSEDILAWLKENHNLVEHKFNKFPDQKDTKYYNPEPNGKPEIHISVNERTNTVSGSLIITHTSL